MSFKTDLILAKMQEEGLSLEEFVSEVLLVDDSNAYAIIKKEVELGKAVGLSADIVFNWLNTIIDENYIYTYVQVGKFVNSLAAGVVLEVEMFPDSKFVLDDSLKVALEFAKKHKNFVEGLLKDRGVYSVGVVYNAFSDVLTLYGNHDEIVDTPAWQDYFDDMYDYFTASFYDWLEDVFTYELSIEYEDIVDLFKTAFAYTDIYDVLNSHDTAHFNKHEFDIYFAYKAIMGDIFYVDDDVITEILRLYDYLYGGFEGVLNYIGEWKAVNSFGNVDVDEFIDSWVMQQIENIGYGIDFGKASDSYYGVEYIN